MMKKVILMVFVMACSASAWAQQELPNDTLRQVPKATVKEFGGFLLDMGLMMVASSSLPKLDWTVPDASKDYNRLFQLDTQNRYTQGFTDAFSSASSIGYGWGLSSSPQFMQQGTFQLKNGWKMHTYGDYNKEGWRVPNRSAMPWERNNFRGAFELKSANGNFGFRIEVQQGRNAPY